MWYLRPVIKESTYRVVVAHQNVLLLWVAILNFMPSYDVISVKFNIG